MNQRNIRLLRVDYITKVFLRDTNFTYILFLHINLIYFYTIISSQFS